MSRISTLRQRFIDDMLLAGLVPGTQTNYIRSILKLVRHYGQTAPQHLTEPQVEDYIRHLSKTVARGTFHIDYAALKFLYCNTLGRDLAIFTKKK